MAGLTSAGLQIQTLQDIKSDLQGGFRSAYGASINTADQGVIGVFIGILSDQLSQVWQLAQAVYASQFPSTASGASLDNVLEYTGVTRLAASRSIVQLLCTGIPGTFIDQGKTVSVIGTHAQFMAWQGFTIPAGGSITAEFRSVDFGAIVANSGTLTQISTPVGGWTSANNALDAVLGAPQETDAQARIRRVIELQQAGNSSLPSIEARVLNVAGVTSVTVFDNTTDATNSDGMPPHSVEVLALGGSDADVFTAVFNSAPAGIQTWGTQIGSVLDSQGYTQPVRFSRATQVPIYIELTYKYTAEYPDDGDIEVQEAVVQAAITRFQVGNDVVVSALDAPMFGIPGIFDVTGVRAGPTRAGVGTSNIAISNRQLAVFDTSRVILIKTLVPLT